MKDIEHPDITRVNKTGYVNMVSQPEHFGIDYFGDEVLIGDEAVITHEGELVLRGSLEKYLHEALGYTFFVAD